MGIFAQNNKILYEIRNYNEAFCIVLYAVGAHDYVGTETVFPSYWRQFDGLEGKASHRGLSSQTGVSQWLCRSVVSWRSHEVVVVGE